MTNYERIKQVSIDELAEFLDDTTADCEVCDMYNGGNRLCGLCDGGNM